MDSVNKETTSCFSHVSLLISLSHKPSTVVEAVVDCTQPVEDAKLAKKIGPRMESQ